MIETCWQLGGLEQYEELNLRRWAHMLGFRGHFLTKSQRYSTTFRAIRASAGAGASAASSTPWTATPGASPASRSTSTP